MAGSMHDGRDDDLDEQHEINVTPFIDVILVLLIIFMVAAPLSTVDLPVDLPAATAKAQARPDKPVFVTIKSDLTLAVGETSVSDSEFISTLRNAFDNRSEQRIFLRADKAVPYGTIMRVMNALRQGGYLKVALVALDALEDAPSVSGITPPKAQP
jgi:biopolymer transport protein ExbD